jgi:uncharacterized protein with GYD domain
MKPPGRVTMPKYLILLRNDRVGAAQMLATGAAGASDQKHVVAAFNGNVERLFAVTGRFDAALIVDFPDELSCEAFCLAASAHGQYAEALRALEEQEMDGVRARHDDAMAKIGQGAA